MSAEEEEEEAWDDIGRCKLGGEDEADEIGEDDDDGDDVSLEWDDEGIGGGGCWSSFSSDMITNTEELVDWPIFEKSLKRVLDKIRK